MAYKFVTRTARAGRCRTARNALGDIDRMRKQLLTGAYALKRSRAARGAALRSIKACERR